VSPRLPAGPVRAALSALSPLLTGTRTPLGLQRALPDLASRALPLPAGVRVERARAGGVAGERISPAEPEPVCALLYLHGGGYTLGSPRTHRALVARLVAQTGVSAFVAGYRLAPDHPHPAALEDAQAAFAALAREADHVVVAGDSAGGGLALALAMRLRDAGGPVPSAVAMICPWLDLTPEALARRPEAPREPLLSEDRIARWADGFAPPGVDRRDPAVSPLHGDLRGLPPLVLHSAGQDPLIDDAERLERAAAEAGAELEHRRHPGAWHVIHVLAGALTAADEAVDALARSLRVHFGLDPPAPRVAIVGAGMSGLCMGAKLRAAGIEDFTIHEKAEEVGGTWRENTYPGLTCDVPARFYAYSFALNPDWTSSFAPGGEIQDYFVATSERLALRERVRFGSEVVDARWREGHWRLESADGRTDEADVLVTATGVLHHPRYPAVEGLDSFAGALFHSARWDHDVELAGRRVAVVGTGSTGAQIVSELAGTPELLTLFQRTAQWIVPVPNVPYPAPVRALMRGVPPLNRFAYRLYQQALEAILSPATLRDGWQRSLIGAICRLNLRYGIGDGELRERLRPGYEPLCKRLVMSSRFYPAMNREDVALVTDPIERVVPEGIVTADGTLHELDVIVLATGFDAHAYVAPMRIEGAEGATIEEAWGGRPRAYRTIAVPGFPNLFMLMGPHSPVGNHSLVAVAETQSDYVVEWIERMRREGVSGVSPTEDATAAFNASMREALPGTVWTTGCDSWYLDADGVPAVWPWSPRRHRLMLAEPEPDDFVVV
jgi:cation diffusion facilitator CzcD-associated flavoprotein CzcO/acetyl esterase/lipase